MAIVTSKGQVALPQAVLKAAGLKPGDKVDVRATASGGGYIERPGALRQYDARLRALANRRLIRDGMTTDEFMELSRGEIAASRRRKK
jgi:bifunctional DNA-binding transcriptional regulator/antitoxin component of YhaV-PrlF toxin-antitoxin module